MDKEKILVTIAARGGSKGVKDKNIRLLCGLPLIAHTIKQARAWGKADRIVCSTDSEQIAGLAKQYGAEVPFRRPVELAGDEVGKIDVLRQALLASEGIYREKYSIVVDLDVTAPLRKLSDIGGAFRLFKEKRPKNVFSVVRARKNPYFNMVEIDQNGYANLSKDPGYNLARRQDAPQVYDVNASIYIYDRDYLVDPDVKSVISDRSLVWVMDEQMGFDIDSETDIQFIEFLVEKGLVEL